MIEITQYVLIYTHHGFYCRRFYSDFPADFPNTKLRIFNNLIVNKPGHLSLCPLAHQSTFVGQSYRNRKWGGSDYLCILFRLDWLPIDSQRVRSWLNGFSPFGLIVFQGLHHAHLSNISVTEIIWLFPCKLRLDREQFYQHVDLSIINALFVCNHQTWELFDTWDAKWPNQILTPYIVRPLFGE